MSVDHNIVRFQISVDDRFVVKRKIYGIARGDQVPEHRPNLIDKITLRDRLMLKRLIPFR